MLAIAIAGPRDRPIEHGVGGPVGTCSSPRVNKAVAMTNPVARRAPRSFPISATTPRLQDRQFATGRSASFRGSPARESAGLSSPGWPCSRSARAADHSSPSRPGTSTAATPGEPHRPAVCRRAVLHLERGRVAELGGVRDRVPRRRPTTRCLPCTRPRRHARSKSAWTRRGPHRLQRCDGQLEHRVGQVGGAMHAAHHPRPHIITLRCDGPLSAHLRACV